jgi:hypothetical protein
VLLDAQRREMSELLAGRARREAAFLEQYLAAVEDYQRRLEELHVRHWEEYQVCGWPGE